MRALLFRLSLALLAVILLLGGGFFVVEQWSSRQYYDELTQRLNIPRRSTLVVLKGDAELGRIVAGTSEAQIKDLLDTALRAATA